MMELTVPSFTKVGGRALFTTKENNIILFIAVNFIGDIIHSDNISGMT